MPRKPKTNQKQDEENISGRDLFQTPNYAVDLLVPYLAGVARGYRGRFSVWECAAGLGKIVDRLIYHDFDVYATDLDGKNFPRKNFLIETPSFKFDCIITNTPFSIKEKFYKKCLEYDVPFALLIPADYSGWIIDAVQNGCEKIIPTRRIDYITPNILRRIWEGEVWKLAGLTTHTMNEFKETYPASWEVMMEDHTEYRYETIYDVPSKLLRRYSSSYFHSMWLTRGFNIGRTEIFVELTNEMKDNI